MKIDVKVSRREGKVSPREPIGSRRVPKVSPREPKGSPREPNRSQKGAKSEAKIDKDAPKGPPRRRVRDPPHPSLAFSVFLVTCFTKKR